MIRVFYVSIAAGSVDTAVVDKIASESAIRNHERKITGALGFNGKTFGQVLEGDEETVTELLDTIRGDARNTGLIEVARIRITDRVFYDWGMRRLETPSFDELIAVMIDE